MLTNHKLINLHLSPHTCTNQSIGPPTWIAPLNTVNTYGVEYLRCWPLYSLNVYISFNHIGYDDNFVLLTHADFLCK